MHQRRPLSFLPSDRPTTANHPTRWCGVVSDSYSSPAGYNISMSAWCTRSRVVARSRLIPKMSGPARSKKPRQVLSVIWERYQNEPRYEVSCESSFPFYYLGTVQHSHWKNEPSSLAICEVYLTVATFIQKYEDLEIYQVNDEYLVDNDMFSDDQQQHCRLFQVRRCVPSVDFPWQTFLDDLWELFKRSH